MEDDKGGGGGGGGVGAPENRVGRGMEDMEGKGGRLEYLGEGIGRNRAKLCNNAIGKGLNRRNKRKGVDTMNARNCTVLMISKKFDYTDLKKLT